MSKYFSINGQSESFLLKGILFVSVTEDLSYVFLTVE